MQNEHMGHESFSAFRPCFGDKWDPQSRDLTQLSSGYNFSVKPATNHPIVHRVGCTFEMMWPRNIQNDFWTLCVLLWNLNPTIFERNRFNNSVRAALNWTLTYHSSWCFKNNAFIILMNKPENSVSSTRSFTQ